MGEVWPYDYESTLIVSLNNIVKELSQPKISQHTCRGVAVEAASLRRLIANVTGRCETCAHRRPDCLCGRSNSPQGGG